jgi:hypothetical protein
MDGFIIVIALLFQGTLKFILRRINAQEMISRLCCFFHNGVSINLVKAGSNTEN